MTQLPKKYYRFLATSILEPSRYPKRAVRRVSGLELELYEERFHKLGLTMLSERRHQAHMQVVHKIMHGSGGLHIQHGLRELTLLIAPPGALRIPITLR